MTVLKRLFFSLTIALLVSRSYADSLEVKIQGIEGEIKENVRAHLSSLKYIGDDGLTPKKIARLHAKAHREITIALQPFGYYHPQIKQQLASPESSSGKSWTATYQIDPGPATLIQQLDIRISGAAGNAPFWLPTLDQLALKENQQLDHRAYEKAKRTLIDSAKRQGYLDVVFTRSRISINRKQQQSNIELHLNSGPLYTVGKVIFKQDLFSDDFMHDFVPFSEGDPYTNDLINEFRQNLYKSGYFREVDIQPSEKNSTTNRIDIIATLNAQKQNRYSARLGYGTDTELGVRLGWDRRYLWGTGQHFNLGLVATQDRKKLVADLSYIIPIDPIKETYGEVFIRHDGKDLTHQDVDLNEGDLTRINNNRIGMALHSRRTLWSGLEVKETISLAYVTEDYDIFQLIFGHLDDDSQSAIRDVIGENQLDILQPEFKALIPSIEWKYRELDDPFYPKHGAFVSLKLQGAYEGLASDTSFLQMVFKANWITSIFEHGRFITRTEIGYTQVENEEALGIFFNQLPESLEFRTGGDRSVRGYDYEELFPTDSITGGKHLFTASIEYEHKFLEDWSAAAFIDVGNAFNDINNMQLKSSIGGGIRWYSPVGLVRMDIGLPQNDGYDKWRFHLTIGPEF